MQKKFEELFPVVRVSDELFLNDKWFQHRPRTYRQKILKDSLQQIIKSGIPDFRRPIMDPSEDEYGDIFFDANSMPATGHSANWWDRVAKMYMPGKNSRLGTQKQYDAFLGVLIKQLVEEQGWRVSAAWKSVCDNSSKLGHYYNSAHAKEEFEPTGSRRIGIWCDLGNTSKIIKNEDNSGFGLASGDCCACGEIYPLSDVFEISDPDKDIELGVGWIVADE